MSRNKKHRLMEITVADSVSPEVQKLVDGWNDALAATLDYMDQHKPSPLGFTKQDQLVFDLPMVAYLSFIAPLVHDAENPEAVMAGLAQKLGQRLRDELSEYSSRRAGGIVV